MIKRNLNQFVGGEQFEKDIEQELSKMALFQLNNDIWEDDYLSMNEGYTTALQDALLFDKISTISNDYIVPDDPFEIFLNPPPEYRSIHGDCKEIESGASSSSASDDSVTSEIFETPKNYELRNHDCMWSGNCDLNKDGTYTCGYRNISSSSSSSSAATATTASIKYQKQQQQQMIAKQINQQQQHQQQQQQQQQNIQNIPPGASLLINSRSNQQQQLLLQQQKQQIKQEKFKIPNVMTSDFLKERESMITGMARPDTPVSLDDDPPEFKHSVDLSACVMGSNNISLEADKIIISKLKEQLEDPSTRSVDIKNIIPGNKQRTLSEVLNVIENDEHDDSYIGAGDDSDSQSDAESTDSSVIYKDPVRSSSSSSNTSNNNNNNNSNSRLHNHQQSNYHNSVMHSDHSYTRSKGGVDIIGLETPSDSDEEIDVVSIGDKKFPTNPSDKDRRVIQNKVAHKISSRMVKTPSGIRTIPPRRRGSLLDPPYTLPPSVASQLNKQNGVTASSAHHHHHQVRYNITSPGSYNNSINGGGNNSSSSPTSGYSSSASSVTSSSSSSRYHTGATTLVPGTTIAGAAGSGGSISSTTPSVIVGGRKRSAASKDEYTPPSSTSKRYRSKNKRSSTKRHFEMDEADTIEKRNLHNDMERQRRIGLKNLFESLKKQIPSIKDKERAPKVNILREAAKLCDQLTKEDRYLTAQRHQLQLQLQRRQAQLKAARSSME